VAVGAWGAAVAGRAEGVAGEDGAGAQALSNIASKIKQEKFFMGSSQEAIESGHPMCLTMARTNRALMNSIFV